MEVRAVRDLAGLESALADPSAVAVVCDRLIDADAETIAARVAAARQRSGHAFPCVRVAADKTRPPASGITYEAEHDLAPEEIAELIIGAVWPAIERSYEEPASPSHAEVIGRALRLARAVARAATPADAAGEIEAWMRSALDSDVEEVLYFDSDEDILWSDARATDADPRRGLLGFAVRSRALLVADSRDDPRFSPAVDDPRQRAAPYYLVVPILKPNGEVSAIAIARREVRPFDEIESFAAEALGDLVGRSIDLLELQLSSDAAIESGAGLPLFRQVAVDAQFEGRGEGDVLRVVPRWVPGTFWLIIAVALGGLALLFLGERTRYERGIAVVRLDRRSDVVATSVGVVSELLVAEGSAVDEGQPIARLYDASEADELRRREMGYESAVASYLRDPNDAAAAVAVESAWQSFSTARGGLAARELSATSAGRVENLQVTVGTSVEVGQAVASIVEASDTSEAVLFLPPMAKPYARVGETVWLRLRGYERARIPARLRSIAEAAVSPERADAILGPRLASSVPLSGPQLVGRASLEGAAITIDGREIPLADGMLASAELATRRTPLYRLLVPGSEEP